jgi:hypothetical protein
MLFVQERGIMQDRRFDTWIERDHANPYWIVRQVKESAWMIWGVPNERGVLLRAMRKCCHIADVGGILQRVLGSPCEGAVVVK